jgi:hypothetical protein
MSTTTEPSAEEVLASIKQSIADQSVSWGELVTLQSLAHLIDPDDVELLHWAGVPEFHGDEDNPCGDPTPCRECLTRDSGTSRQTKGEA